VPSWGTMLSSVQYDLVADRRWWFAFPAVLLTVSTLLSGRVAKTMELR
jgi:ABC-type dipeptide/oligopeptide/nickel transport system permease subunit